MKLVLELEPKETIQRDRTLEITPIGGTNINEQGVAVESIRFVRTRDVIEDGTPKDFETKTGNIIVSRIPKEILEAPQDNLLMIQAFLDSTPESAGMKVVNARIEL